MSSNATGRRYHIGPAALLAGLTLLALVLRVWRLGHWGFEGDEIFTLRDSISPPSIGNSRPLLYFLNYYLLRPLVPLDELGLRLLPALFGVLAVPAFYQVSRRLVGTRAALFAALLLTFNGLHVYQSQSARYWSLVFLLSAVYPFAIYLGIHERSRRALALGLVTGLLAVLAHPTAGLLFGGIALWLVTVSVLEGGFARWWKQRTVRWGAVGIVLLTIGLALWFTPTLQAWMRAPHMARLAGVALVLSYADGLTLGVVLTGAVGVYWLWQEGQRSLALLLACLFVFPSVFCLALSYVTAVSTEYLFATTPVFFLGSGVFLDRLANLSRGLRPSWLLPATIASLLVAANAPFLMSNYRDGSRADFRAAASFLKDRLRPGDVVFSDQSRALHNYLPQAAVQSLTDQAEVLADSLARLRGEHRGGTLWTVALTSTRGGFRKPKLGTVADWVYSNCQLRASIGVPRLDFRQNQLQVYRCPPEAR